MKGIKQLKEALGVPNCFRHTSRHLPATPFPPLTAVPL